MSQLDGQRFAHLWQRLGGQGDPDPLFRALAAAYAEPQRTYHTAAHLQDCLQQFDHVRTSTAQPDQVEMALWFHDGVYDPRAADNEEQSAVWAAQTLTQGGMQQAIVAQVTELILTTKHQSQPKAQDAKLIVDIDLAILGYTPILFTEYDRLIRSEYQWVPALQYRRRRSQILAGFLARDVIYQTAYFHDRYEKQARVNLTNAIAQLNSPTENG